MLQTKEGAVTHEHSMNHHLELFSKGGSLFVRKTDSPYYIGEVTALELFKQAWYANEELAFKLLLWLRDARGGAGNRSAFREILTWLANNKGTSWIAANIDKIPEVGRYDDLRALFNTPAELKAAEKWSNDIKDGNVLAAKWADRKDKPVKHALGFKEEGKFRKFLASIRKNHIVEHKMSTNNFNEIEYNKVPSVAMSRYTNAFGVKDAERFEKFKEKLVSGETTINASVLFPHDCVRTVMGGDRAIADAQFDALPNYMEGTDEKIIVISDTSGSMNTIVSGSISACDISQALALYCSGKIDYHNPFHKKFIGFCSEGSFKSWNGMTFSEAVRSRSVFDKAIGQTRIDKALDLILNTAKFFKLSQDQMPTMLLIVSDMQFQCGVGVDYRSMTEVERCMKNFEEAGYKAPKIVYWNTAGYAGSPGTKHSANIGLVSGFSPSILKAVLGSEDFTPTAIMMKALEKYEVVVPKF